MKLLPLCLLFFFILLSHAQRRTTAKSSTEAETTKSTPLRGRGRSRFVASTEYQTVKDVSSTSDPTTRKNVASRRRVVENIDQKFPSRSTVIPTSTKQPYAATASVDRRLTPAFGDTVEKIFTVNDNGSRRTARPSSSVNTPLSYDNTGRRTPKLLTDYVERRNFKSNKNTYEVQEIVNEDFELVRRSKKPRVSTEPAFRATNFPSRNQESTDLLKSSISPKRNQENVEVSKTFPKRNQANSELTKGAAKSKKNPTSDIPATLPTPIDSGYSNLIEEQPLDSTLVNTLIPSETETSPDPLTETNMQEDITKLQPLSSTVKPTEPSRSQGSRRNGLRKSANVVLEQSTKAPRFRTRGRPTQTPQPAQAPEFNFQATTSTAVPGRSSRRRSNTLVETRKGPSVFTGDSQFQETRSRTGRKIEAPEKLTIDIPTRNRRRTTTSKTPNSSSLPAIPSRNRFRSREPIIDEQKLEVLPLFEEEPKLVYTRVTNRADNLDPRSRKRVTFEEQPRSANSDTKFRRRGASDMIQTSASEMKKKYSKPTETPSRSRVTVSVETRTESSFKRSPNRKTEVKESVVSEVNEVTSRKKVSRKKVQINNRGNVTKTQNFVAKIVPASRGIKKSEVVLKKESSEEIGDSDNYPESFKALLKAKKEKKEPRASVFSLPLRSAKNVVTFVPSSSTTTYTLTTKEINEIDNEVQPQSSTSRWTRTRVTTSPSSVKNTVGSERRFNTKTTASTTPSTTPFSRATKFRTLTPRSFSVAPKLEKTVSFKPRDTSSEKKNEIKRFNRERNGKLSEISAPLPTKVPKYLTTSKKLDRSKLRSDYNSRGSTTSPPKYIPTIPSVPYVPTVPTITPPRTMVDTAPYPKDDDLGLQVISIDEPVNPIQSANLVNGDYVASTANSVSLPLPLVKDGTTEKTVSIIERIINSISAISTTSPPPDTLSSSTSSSTESQSAILKLSPKRSRQTDVTDETKQTNPNGTVIPTTENPTTIIERILSSLNAIQATDNTSSAQVGTAFNTLSSLTTTPLSSVTKSSTSRSLVAPISTTVFPLSILDEITPEELLQNEAIGRLLYILNGLVTTPQTEVVVTPKNVNMRIGRGPYISTTFLPLSTYSPASTTNSKLSTVPSFNTEQLSSNLIFSEAPDITSIPPESTISTLTSSEATISTVTSSEATTSTVTSSEGTSSGIPEFISTEIPRSTFPTTTSSEALLSTVEVNTERALFTSPVINLPDASSSTSSEAASSETQFTSQKPLLTSEAPLSTSTELVSTDRSEPTEASIEFTEIENFDMPEEILMSSSITTESSSIESSTSFPTASEISSTITEAANFFTILSTLPSFQKFEVSPGSVSVFSANDISNSINLEDNISTTSTVNIAGRSNFDNITTTQSTTTDGTALESATVDVTTEESVQNSSGPMESSTPTVNNIETNSTRSGKLLNFVQDPVQNRIDTSTPDYFIFAILNNNTILRKRPLVEPNSPFYVIGVYPNNTIVKKYLNGTIVPMEMIIRVRGFDTRDNPPPLPDITSNQVTSDPGSSMDKKFVETDEQNTIPSTDVKPLSVPSTSTVPNIFTTKAPSSTTETTQSMSTTTPSPTPAIAQSSTTQFTTTSPTTVSTKAQSSTTVPTTTSPVAVSTLSSNTPTPIPVDVATLSTLQSESTKLTSTESSTIPQSINEASTIVPDMVTVDSSTVFITTLGSNNNPSTFPTLSELFNGKTLDAFNEIISNSDNTNTNTSDKIETSTGRVSKVDTTTALSNDNASSTSSVLPSTVSTVPTTGKTAITAMKVDSTTTEDAIFLSNRIVEETTRSEIPKPVSAIQRIGTTPRPTTIVAMTEPTWTITSSPRSIFPTFLTTFFPNLFNVETTTSPTLSTTEPAVIRISAAPSVSKTTFIASTTYPTASRFDTTNLPTTTTIEPVTTTSSTALPTESITTEPSTLQTTTIFTSTTKPITTTRFITTTQPTRPTTAIRYTSSPVYTITTRPPRAVTTTRSITTTTKPATTTGEPIQIIEASTTERNVAVTDFNTIEITTKSLKFKELTPEQKQNLKMIAQLEKEQAALFKQLSFLTNLGLGPNREAKSVPTSENRKPKSNPGPSLAERIVALAVERDKTKTTSIPTTAASTKIPTSIQDQLASIAPTRPANKITPGLEDVLKQYNLNGLETVATSPSSTVYGKSEDAILASILKDQGIVPSTPRVLAGIFDETTIRPRPRPRTTTPPSGPLMRGLNWLLNTLAPSPQPAVVRRPTNKPVKPKKPPVEEELLVNSPTHMTPVVTPAPSKLANALSQEDIQKLIKQLEGIQKNPSKGALDLSQIKSIQNLINIDDGVVVSTNGEHGTTSRRATTLPTTIQTQITERQPRRLPTENPILAVSNSDEDIDIIESTTRVLRAPNGFNPVPGVDDGSPNPLIRSNLITAAVNVTKAISSFLGTALQTVSQGAAASFQSLFGVSQVGTRLLGNAAGGSSAG